VFKKLITKETQLNSKEKFLELVLLFVATPILLLVPIPLYIKLSYLFIGTIYILWVSIKKEKFEKTKTTSKDLRKALKNIFFRFFCIVIFTTIFIYFQDRESLFAVMLNKTTLWLKFNLIYVLASVIPQELIYRSFFVKRYQNLFKNEYVFLLINASLFSFAHIWFQSWVVLLFTFIGGILFIKTYLQTKSLWLVLLEHSLYGIWLYTVGYGKLFMFPV